MQKSILAIDIGGTNTKLALVDIRGNTGQVQSLPTSDKDGLDEFLSAVNYQAKELIRQAPNGVEGVGIGIAGFVDSSHTRMVFNPNIPWLEGIDFRSYFSNSLGLPVFVEIDSNAAALAEAVHGAGRDHRRVLVLAVGTGLGGGMTVDKQIMRISNECLGDVGHVIVEKDGTVCASGCRGCAEAMVSSSALIRYAEEYMLAEKESIGYEDAVKGGLDVPFIIQAVHNNDEAALSAIRKMGDYLGRAIASIAPIFSPDIICIAGGISEAGEAFIRTAEFRFKELSGTPYTEGVQVKKALMGWQSVLVGSAQSFRCQ